MNSPFEYIKNLCHCEEATPTKQSREKKSTHATRLPRLHSVSAQNDMKNKMQNKLAIHRETGEDISVEPSPAFVTHFIRTTATSPVGRGALCAFSLVEAMIILLLISIAIMALIPLMLPHQNLIPRWKITRDDNGANVNAISYGKVSMDRVGIGGVDPFTIHAKLAATSLSVNNTTPPDSAIFWGDNFVSSSYCTKPDDNCTGIDKSQVQRQTTNSIQIGMNSCADTNDTPKLIIRSGYDSANQADNRNHSCANELVNINDRIVVNNNGFGIGTQDVTGNIANNSAIYITQNGTHDKFAIQVPDGANTLQSIMDYDNTNTNVLTIVPAVTVTGDTAVHGDVILAGYIAGNEAPTNGTTLQCDLSDGVCANLNNNFPDTTNTYSYSNSVTSLSDRRLKNILKDYTKGLDEILKIDTYTYTYKNDKKNRSYVGIIAQKLIGIFDEALHKDASGYYSYERTPLLYAMTNSAKEINSKQNQFSDKNKELNKKADKLIKMYK